MSKKSFKDNPAMAFITHTTDYTHDTGMKETKSKRLNLLLTPSLHSNLLKIARVEGISLNELINIVLKKHEQQNQEAINKFTDIWGGTMTEIKLYSLKELATLLSVTERTLHNYIKSGKMKGQKIGGKWQISESNLRKFVNGE